MNFHNFIKLSRDLEVKPLLQEIQEQPSLWKEITARQTTPGTAHTDTESIFLRWSENLTVPAAFTEIPAVNYPAYETLKSSWPLIGHTLDRVKADKLGRVLVTSLAPGGVIRPHIDEGDYADHYERFHISLQSEPGNVFSIEDVPGCGEYVYMAPGELWWFNHKKRHAVINASDKPRIHLVIDAVAPLYRRERDVLQVST